jgi:hypothetical protein
MLPNSHIQTSASLEPWNTLLQSWITQVKRYCTTVVGDNPYWYGEQTNVAFLTGAAFPLEEWFALTEFSLAKEGVVHTYGRGDAWLYDGLREYYIEAKHCWIELEREDYVATIQNAMANAQNAARVIAIEPLATSTQIYRVALVFICPRHSLETLPEPEQALLQLQTYLQQQPFDALAWIFPGSTYLYHSQRTNKHYPGVMLVAKIVERVR